MGQGPWMVGVVGPVHHQLEIGQKGVVAEAGDGKQAIELIPTIKPDVVLMDIVLANPRGFCAGVDRAIDIVERAIVLFGAPIFVRHEVVHNRHVVDRLRDMGAVFVEELDEITGLLLSGAAAA